MHVPHQGGSAGQLVLPIWVRKIILFVIYFNQVSRWKGRLSPADLVWAVPSSRGVLVCIDLQGEKSILIFDKDGTFRMKKIVNFSICDAGIDQF